MTLARTCLIDVCYTVCVNNNLKGNARAVVWKRVLDSMLTGNKNFFHLNVIVSFTVAVKKCCLTRDRNDCDGYV